MKSAKVEGMTQLSLLRPIDEFNLLACHTPAVSGRVVHVQTGRSLSHQRRIRVIDDFDTAYQTVAAEMICTESAAKAVSLAMQILFGAERVVERGEFAEHKTAVHYQVPPSGRAARYPDLLSEESISEQWEKESQMQKDKKRRSRSRRRQGPSHIQQAAKQLLISDSGSRLVMQMYPSDRNSCEYQQAMRVIRGEEKLSADKAYSDKIRALGAIRALADNTAGINEDLLAGVIRGIRALQEEALEHLDPNNPDGDSSKAYAVIYASQLIAEGLGQTALQSQPEASQIREKCDLDLA